MKEDNKIYIIIICIMGAIILLLGSYLIFDKVILKEHNNIKNKAENIINKIEDKIEDKLDEDKNEEINNNNNQNKKYCEGTYYGKEKVQIGNNEFKEVEYEYKLNDDGTFYTDNNHFHKAYYIITDNTITFITPVGVCNGEECKHYSSSSYYIKDCEYFIDNNDIKYEKK